MVYCWSNGTVHHCGWANAGHTNNFWAQVHINEMNCRFYVQSVQNHVMWCGWPGLCLRLYENRLGCFFYDICILSLSIYHSLVSSLSQHILELYAGFWMMWNEWVYKRTNRLLVCVCVCKYILFNSPYENLDDISMHTLHLEICMKCQLIQITYMYFGVEMFYADGSRWRKCYRKTHLSDMMYLWRTKTQWA